MRILGDNILIERKTMEVKVGSIVLPNETGQIYGEVLQLGEGVPKDCPIKVGDKILWGSNIMGIELKIEKSKNPTYIMKVSDIVVIF
jgi:co-chaperonin GroES (HSP10)